MYADAMTVIYVASDLLGTNKEIDAYLHELICVVKLGLNAHKSEF